MISSAAFVVSETGHLLLVVSVLAWAGGRILGSQRGALLGFAIGAVLSVLTGEWSPTFYTRALFGDLSALSWVFLAHLLLVSVFGKESLAPPEFRALALPAVIGAFLIYPATLGIPGAPDFYNADFGGFALLSASLVAVALYLKRGFFVAAAGVGFGFFLYGLDLHESANLWDCLIDFPSVIVSGVILVKWTRAHRRLRRMPDGASIEGS